MDSDKAERLYLRAMNIREGDVRGLWMPILWHLALRGFAPAMIDLADWLSSGPRNTVLGAPGDRFSSAGYIVAPAARATLERRNIFRWAASTATI